MADLKWLHFSDLHFSAQDSYDTANMRKALLTCLEEERFPNVQFIMSTNCPFVLESLAQQTQPNARVGGSSQSQGRLAVVYDMEKCEIQEGLDIRAFACGERLPVMSVE